jgi:hypothetical protein
MKMAQLMQDWIRPRIESFLRDRAGSKSRSDERLKEVLPLMKEENIQICEVRQLNLLSSSACLLCQKSNGQSSEYVVSDSFTSIRATFARRKPIKSIKCGTVITITDYSLVCARPLAPIEQD